MRQLPGLGAVTAVEICDPEIQDSEKEEPHHVDEVPVKGDCVHRDGGPRREMPPVSAEPNQDEQDQATQHVGAVEAGQREERASECVRLQGKTTPESLDELVGLQRFEQGAKDD